MYSSHCIRVVSTVLPGSGHSGGEVRRSHRFGWLALTNPQGLAGQLPIRPELVPEVGGWASCLKVWGQLWRERWWVWGSKLWVGYNGGQSCQAGKLFWRSDAIFWMWGQVKEGRESSGEPGRGARQTGLPLPQTETGVPVTESTPLQSQPPVIGRCVTMSPRHVGAYPCSALGEEWAP